MTKNAVQYAEEDLDVHGVYAEAYGLSGDLDNDLKLHAQALGQKAVAVAGIEKREAEIRSDEMGKNSEMSAARFEQHFRAIKARDAVLVNLNQELINIQYSIHQLEADIRSKEQRIKVLTARMMQLGGYLNYLAAAKQAQGAKQ